MVLQLCTIVRDLAVYGLIHGDISNGNVTWAGDRVLLLDLLTIRRISENVLSGTGGFMSISTLLKQPQSDASEYESCFYVLLYLLAGGDLPWKSFSVSQGKAYARCFLIQSGSTKMRGFRGFSTSASDTFHAAKEAMSTKIDLKTGLGIGVALTELDAWVVNMAIGGVTQRRGGVESKIFAVGVKVDAKSGLSGTGGFMSISTLLKQPQSDASEYESCFLVLLYLLVGGALPWKNFGVSQERAYARCFLIQSEFTKVLRIIPSQSREKAVAARGGLSSSLMDSIHSPLSHLRRG